MYSVTYKGFCLVKYGKDEDVILNLINLIQ